MITIDNLEFAYSKQEALFKDLGLELNPGSITGLLGANGAGKTTLLKLLSGLLSISHGTIKVNRFLPQERHVSMLEDIYFLPEEYFLPQVKISTYMKAQSGFYPKFNRDKFNSILKDFDLLHSSRIDKLSHGQKKKFLVSFALATNCALLVLDEPTNGLDIPSKALLRRILAGSIDDEQLVIISTHQVKDIENLIDNIVILSNGKVVFHEKTSTISEKLIFSTARDTDEKTSIYTEAVPGGYKSISRQNNRIATELDIELLFNAVNSGTKIFTEHESK